MRIISFITTADKKYMAFIKHVHIDGVEFERVSLDTPEIQATHAQDVALFSARYMADKLHKPVICEDVSHEINALHGFPGVYLKYIEQQIGADGFLKLLEGKERTSRFVLAVSYADPEGHSFVTSTCTDGHIGFVPEGAGHIMDTIFIPHGTNYSIAKLIEMGDFDRPHDHYDRLCTYIKSLT